MVALVASLTKLGVLAALPLMVEQGYQEVLLGFSPMRDELYERGDEHYDFFEFVLSVFGEYKSIEVALIGHNSKANRAFGRLFERVIVGCHSHHFDLVFALAVKDEIQE